MSEESLQDRRRERVAERLESMHESASVEDEGRNVTFALKEIERICNTLGLTDVVENIAERLYRQVLEEDLLRGRSIEGVTSAVVYIASRQAEDIRTLDEIADESTVSEKEVGKIYRDIRRELEIPMAPVHPSDYVRRFVEEGPCESYDLDCRRLRDMAMTIIGECRDRGMLSGRSPKGYAAAAIYVVTGDMAKRDEAQGIPKDERAEKITQAELADHFGVSQVTIRKAYKGQVAVGKELGLVTPEAFPKIEPSD